MTESVTGSAATGPATTQRREFRLPDVGEGLTEADIVSWRVQPGDTVIGRASCRERVLDHV
jgi:pyruvate dehydrogenase E2 component (dihydrolipoamide acetyltransferase)